MPSKRGVLIDSTKKSRCVWNNKASGKNHRCGRNRQAAMCQSSCDSHVAVTDTEVQDEDPEIFNQLGVFKEVFLC